MKVYRLSRKQFLPISLVEAWSFFSSPQNLGKVTPPRLRFSILHNSGSNKMFSGQIIRYRIHIFPAVPVQWVTEITVVDEPFGFVDVQRSGPYKLWRHEHHFKEVTGGVEMTDVVNYAIPFGLVGRLAHWIFVARDVNAIFDYRYTFLEAHFTK